MRMHFFKSIVWKESGFIFAYGETRDCQIASVMDPLKLKHVDLK